MIRADRFLPLQLTVYEPLRSLGLASLRCWQLAADERIQRYITRWHHLVFVPAGRIELNSTQFHTTIDGNGPACLIPACCDFRICAVTASRIMIAYLDPDLLMTKDLPALWPERLARELLLAWEGLFLQELHDQDEVARQSWCAVACMSLQRGLRALGISPTRHDRQGLAHLLATLDDSLEMPWSLPEMASLLSCSVSELGRRFAEAGLQSPMRELRERRLRCAAMILRQTEATVMQIANRVGFATPFALSRAFKQRFGCSPRKYRQQSRPGNADSEQPPR